MRRFPGVASILFASIASAGAGAVAGCGKTQTFSDAPTGIDSATPDAILAGDVTVTTHSRCCTKPSGTLEPDIDVIVVQPDGTAGPTGKTNASGTITLGGVREGAAVTVVYPVEEGYELATVLGVRPGDDLVFGERYQPTLGAGTGVVTITFPSYTGASYYYAYHPCGSDYAIGEASTSIAMTRSCDATTANVLLVAYDSGFSPVATGVKRGAPFNDTDSSALTAWVPTAPNNFTETINGLPPEVNSVYLGASMVVDGGPNFQTSVYAPPTAGSATGTVYAPAGGDRIYAYAQLYRTGQLGRHEVYRAEAGDATSSTFTTPNLPWLGQGIVSGAAQVATWVQVGGGDYDAAVVNMSWSRYDANLQMYRYYRWNVAIPPHITTWTWSTVPASLSAYVPSENDNTSGQVMLVDLSSAIDYAELHNKPEWQWSCPRCATYDGELPSANVAYPFDGGEGFVAHRK